MDLSVQLSHPSQALSSLLTETSGPKRRPKKQIPKKQRQRRLTEDEVDRLVADYEAGASAVTLAKRFGVHRTSVTGYLDRRQVKRRITHNKLTTIDLDEVVRLYVKGESLAKVGQVFSVDAATIARALRQQGIQLRPRRGWNK